MCGLICFCCGYRDAVMTCLLALDMMGQSAVRHQSLLHRYLRTTLWAPFTYEICTCIREKPTRNIAASSAKGAKQTRMEWLPWKLDVTMSRTWPYALAASYMLSDQRLAEIWAPFFLADMLTILIGGDGQTKIKNPNGNFCDAWSEDNLLQIWYYKLIGHNLLHNLKTFSWNHPSPLSLWMMGILCVALILESWPRLVVNVARSPEDTFTIQLNSFAPISHTTA